ncbi:MAG: helix-turn-helix domain-containing protein [Thiohalocapsa sp.]
MALQDRKEREFERREQDILIAALELCSTPRWESVTVERIAERAEVGKGTVYKHFASKDELLFRLMMRFYRGLLRMLSDGIVNGSPLDQLRDAIDRALRCHIANGEYRYVVEYCERIDFKERTNPAWRDDFLEMDRAFQAWGGPIIEAGMVLGQFQRRPRDARAGDTGSARATSQGRDSRLDRGAGCRAARGQGRARL